MNFLTAQELGIKEGDIMLTGRGTKVEVLNTATVPLTRNLITVREVGDKYPFYMCADSLKPLNQ